MRCLPEGASKVHGLGCHDLGIPIFELNETVGCLHLQTQAHIENSPARPPEDARPVVSCLSLRDGNTSNYLITVTPRKMLLCNTESGA